MFNLIIKYIGNIQIFVKILINYRKIFGYVKTVYYELIIGDQIKEDKYTTTRGQVHGIHALRAGGGWGGRRAGESLSLDYTLLQFWNPQCSSYGEWT